MTLYFFFISITKSEQRDACKSIQLELVYPELLLDRGQVFDVGGVQDALAEHVLHEGHQRVVENQEEAEVFDPSRLESLEDGVEGPGN